MSEIFKHTQNISSVSKLVLIVKNLETNLEKFMKKIIYYEGFFKNIKDKIPQEIYYIIRKLILRSYEYREMIREELNSKLAYIVDIGRWIIGVEDWNTKMEKRSNQLSELVILSNSLLSLYYINGKIINVDDDLINYVNSITGIIILDDINKWNNEIKKNYNSPKYNTKIKLIEDNNNNDNNDNDIILIEDDILNPFN
jgi:hypothetical protein